MINKKKRKKQGLAYFINVFGIFLMRQFYLDLPNDYLEAAEVDGYGHFR